MRTISTTAKDVETEGGSNNLFHAVLLQLHIPRGLTPDIVCHQLAAYMTLQVSFFYPKMKDYLKDINLAFNACIMHLFYRIIWADEYIIGALGKMSNVKISVVSPYYTDIFNVYHNNAIPDVILVANGDDFGGKNGMTHFSLTKGVKPNWKCIGMTLTLAKLDCTQDTQWQNSSNRCI